MLIGSFDHKNCCLQLLESIMTSSKFEKIALFSLVYIFSFTHLNSQVWTEDFEGEWVNDWHVDGGTWAIGEPASGPGSAFFGSSCAATVLDGNYSEPADTRLIRHTSFTVPSASENPRLRFWYWFSFSSGDYGEVQVKVGTSDWESVSNQYNNKGGNTWSYGLIDLSDYENQTIQIAFNFHSERVDYYNPDVSSGWYIDDVSLETGSYIMNNPEDFELGFGDWSVEEGSWEIGAPLNGPTSAYEGQKCAGTNLNGNYEEAADSRFISPPFLVPSASENPAIRFWHWFNFSSGDYGEIQISTDRGLTWDTISSEFVNTSSNSWTPFYIELNSYINKEAQIAFNFHSERVDYYNPDVSSGWYIDDINILGLQAQNDPIISVISPNGGELLTIGYEKEISWSSRYVENIKIDYSTNNGSSWTTLVASEPAASNSYSWTVPNTPSTECKVRISNADSTALFDESDGVFTIGEADLNTDLIAFYPFNGNINDESGFGHHGQIVGGVNLTTDRFNENNSAYQFNGVDGYINIPNKSTLQFSDNQFSICIWFKINEWTTGGGYNYGAILAKEEDTEDGISSEADYELLIVNDSLGFYPYTNFGYQFERNRWYFMCILNKENEAALYLDGNRIFQTDYKYLSQFRNTENDLHLGANLSSNDEFLNGILDDIRLYDRLLSENEISELYSAGSGPAVSLFSPNGNENWQIGSTQTITWSSFNVENIKLEYSLDNGTNWSTIVSSIASSLTGYSWTIPNMPSTECKLRISDVSDISINDESDAVFTISAISAPVALAADNINTTSFRARWESSEGAESYELDVSTNEEFSAFVTGYESINVSSTNGEVSGLESNNTYFYRVRAINSASTSSNSNIITVTTFDDSQPVLSVSPLMRNVTSTIGNVIFAVTNSGDGTLNWSALSDQSWAAISSGSSGTNDGLISVAFIENTGSTSRLATITITAAGAAGSPKNVTIQQAGAVVLPSTLALNHTEHFPIYSNSSDYNSTDYRLIGIPGNSSTKINEFIGGTQGENWEIYWDNGNSSDYYVKFEDSENFTCSPGKAFWLINKGSWSLNSVNVPSCTLDENLLTSINILPDKFNLITNPFLENVSWSDILEYNEDLVKQPVQWGGNVLALADTLKPFVGYILDNTSSSLTEIKIPYLPFGLQKNGIDASSWNVSIELKSDNFIDKTTFLGISGKAKNTLDKFDMRKPRLIADIPQLYFSKPEWDNENSAWGSDIRNSITDIQIWELIVVAKINDEANINFNNMSNVPEELEIFLIDNSTAKSQDLRTNPNYTFKPKRSKTSMSVLIGKEEFVHSELSKVIPTEFDLLNNYPNPFNPTTTIPVVIPEKRNIKVEVYNILGEKVSELYNGELGPGIHYMEWNGKDERNTSLSSGVYFYLLRMENSKNISRKMVLMK